MPDSMLAQLMQKAVYEENYEEAAKIKSEIERRKE
ncbi:MAG: UvrB/UvrC motif-containing protein [Muribaculaceae bacterium]|nr:UvrB/UvrC motif-containing protein [Muribaculaceae bacterium]